MNNVRCGLIWLSLACTTMVQAQEGAPTSASQLAPEQLEPIELDKLEVLGTLTLRQAAAFRSLRMAMDQPYSSRREDDDKWRCWFEKPVGSRLNHLHCARNGDLRSQNLVVADATPDIARVIPMEMGGDGRVLVSQRPLSEGRLRRVMQTVLGPADNDEAFIGIARSGEEPPSDIPGAGELDQFALAWREIGQLQAEGANEDRQILAIEQTGLSLERYNRIATLVETYPYIHNQVSLRLRD